MNQNHRLLIFIGLVLAVSSYVAFVFFTSKHTPLPKTPVAQAQPLAQVAQEDDIDLDNEFTSAAALTSEPVAPEAARQDETRRKRTVRAKNRRPRRLPRRSQEAMLAPAEEEVVAEPTSSPEHQVEKQRIVEDKMKNFEDNMAEMQRRADEELSKLTPEQKAEVDQNIAAIQNNISETLKHLESLSPEEQEVEIRRLEAEKNEVMEKLKAADPQAYELLKSMDEMGEAMANAEQPQQ